MSLKNKIISILVIVSLIIGGFFYLITRNADKTGEVSTKFKLFGSDKIVIETIEDPGVPGVTCFISRAKTGGISGKLGLAEDTSDASIACRQTGYITLSNDIIDDGMNSPSRVFKKSTNIYFKTLNVMRFYDIKKNTLLYLTYTDKLLEGSAKNSITAVVIQNKLYNKPKPKVINNK